VRHLAEHDVARDARVIDQHVDFAAFGFHLVERGLGGFPVTHVAF
jgi:hypothetical protein